jgi:hypothetical protein
MANETHLLIRRPRSAVTACGKHFVAIYPHTTTAQPARSRGHISYTILLNEVTRPGCAERLERPTEMRRRKMKTLMVASAVLCGCINATTAQGLTVMIFTPKARTCEEVFSLESIVRAAQSNGTIWVDSGQARAVGWYDEVSGWIEGYLTRTNVYDARNGGTGT